MPLPSLLSVIGLIAWLGYEVVLRNRDSGTRTWRARSGDRGSTYVILGAYVAAGAVAMVLRPVPAGHIPETWRWAGVVLLVPGLLLRGWGMHVLGRSYTRTLRTSSDQRLVTDGPYRLIRHPGYAGSLLVWIGYAIGIGSWISPIIITVLLLAAYTWRIRAEEKLLGNSFGVEYADYCRHTARLVPFLY